MIIGWHLKRRERNSDLLRAIFAQMKIFYLVEIAKLKLLVRVPANCKHRHTNEALVLSCGFLVVIVFSKAQFPSKCHAA